MSALFNAILTFIQGWAAPLAAIALAACGLTWAFSSNPQSVGAAKSWFFRILIGLAIVFMATTITNFVQTAAQKVDINEEFNIPG